MVAVATARASQRNRSWDHLWRAVATRRPIGTLPLPSLLLQKEINLIFSGEPVFQGSVVQMAAGFLPSVVCGNFGHLVHTGPDESLNAFHDQVADAVELFRCHPRHGSMCKRVPRLYREFKNSPGQGLTPLGNMSGESIPLLWR
jgi:hypothetical protein